MLIPNDKVNMLNTFSVMIIFIPLLLLTNLLLKLLSTQGIGADKLLSTQRVSIHNVQYLDVILFVVIHHKSRIHALLPNLQPNCNSRSRLA